MSSEPKRLSHSILVVDDDDSIRDLLKDILETSGYFVVTAGDARSGLHLLGKKNFHLVILDLRMPEMDGIELLKIIHRDYPEVITIVLTAYGTVDSAVEAMKLGAFDYLSKPLSSPDELRVVVSRALAHKKLLDENSLLRGDEEKPVYVDPAMESLMQTVHKIAATNVTVLILGESGTGKEIVARQIHQASSRSSNPFVAINCAALAETLLESELFGHEKGAFTGAIGRKRGKFEVADGGTLLLDEIGEMSPALQAKLLRVLQEGTFERVGGTVPIQVDVRIIAATNRDLDAMIKANLFRADLYYRINVMPIRIPPLRDRPSDIIPLASHFLSVFSKKHGKTVRDLVPDAADKLMRYNWPGNIRELMNVIERAIILAEAEMITSDLLMMPSRIQVEPLTTLNLTALEKQAISMALKKSNGNRRRAAELLGISLRTLQYKIKDFGLSMKEDDVL